jgi:hypothetical protein
MMIGLLCVANVDVADALVPSFFFFGYKKNHHISAYVVVGYHRYMILLPVVHHLDILNEDMPVAFGYGGGGW